MCVCMFVKFVLHVLSSNRARQGIGEHERMQMSGNEGEQ